jgi:hypothetical protein
MTQSIVLPGHPSDAATAPSRDMARAFGHGTARREDPNMLPSRKGVAVVLGGKTQPQWSQSRAVENKGGVLPKSRAMDVLVRSGNQDNAAVGMPSNGSHWGIMGLGGPPLPAPVSTETPGWAKLASIAFIVWLTYQGIRPQHTRR